MTQPIDAAIAVYQGGAVGMLALVVGALVALVMFGRRRS